MRLFLGIFLSDTSLLDGHIHHEENGTIENVFDCKRCEVYAKNTRRRELTASLVIARHLKNLKHIGWSTCFLWDSTVAGQAGREDETLIEEVAKNEVDNIASTTSTNNFGDQCHDEECNVGMTTELFITRTTTRTTVERVA